MQTVENNVSITTNNAMVTIFSRWSQGIHLLSSPPLPIAASFAHIFSKIKSQQIISPPESEEKLRF